MAPPESTATKPRTARTPAERREMARLIAGLLIGGLVTAFALLNLNDVKVNWIVGTGQTPLIVVIVLAFVLGMAADRLLLRARRRRRTKA